MRFTRFTTNKTYDGVVVDLMCKQRTTSESLRNIMEDVSDENNEYISSFDDEKQLNLIATRNGDHCQETCGASAESRRLS